MGVGERVVDEFDWSAYGICGGSGAQKVRASVLKFINGESDAEARETWMEIENAVFVPHEIYTSAEPVVEVLVAALSDDRPRWVRLWIVEMLRFLLSFGSPEDPTLAERCRGRAAKAVWLLVGLAREETGGCREDVLEVLSLIDPDVQDLYRGTSNRRDAHNRGPHG